MQHWFVCETNNVNQSHSFAGKERGTGRSYGGLRICPSLGWQSITTGYEWVRFHLQCGLAFSRLSVHRDETKEHADWTNERGIGWVGEPPCYPSLCSTTAIKLFRSFQPTGSLEQAKCGFISAFSCHVVFIRWNWWGKGKKHRQN